MPSGQFDSAPGSPADRSADTSHLLGFLGDFDLVGGSAPLEQMASEAFLAADARVGDHDGAIVSDAAPWRDVDPDAFFPTTAPVWASASQSLGIQGFLENLAAPVEVQDGGFSAGPFWNGEYFSDYSYDWSWMDNDIHGRWMNLDLLDQSYFLF